jgi:hypothetical protein
MCKFVKCFTHLRPSLLNIIMATADIERLDEAIKAVEVKIETIERQLSEKGLSDEMQIALRKNIDTYGADKARLEDKKTKLEGSALSGNPISLPKVFIKCLNAWLLCRSPSFVEATPLAV